MSVSLKTPTAAQSQGGVLTNETLNAILADLLALQAGLANGAIGDAQLASNTLPGLSAVRVAHATYNFAVDGGATGLITPAANFSLPINAIVIGAIIDCTTAGVGATNTTSFGLSGTGGGAAVLKAATAVASLTGFLQAIPLQSSAATFIKLTTAGGQFTITPAVAALTAGVFECYVFYVACSS